MSIIACGINHKTAPIVLREKVIFPLEKLALYLNDLLVNENIREAVLLSTCNRSELYCEVDDAEKALGWFCRQHDLSREELQSAMVVYQDQEAVAHIMNVACGLDSMVLGESQILGQMKTAFSESCAAGIVGTVFNRLFQHVFAVAKEVRTNTTIGACPVSVSSTAVNLVKQLAPNLHEATVLAVGAGDTIDLVLRYLQPHSVKQLFICNRSEEKAIELAKKHAGKNINFADLVTALTHVDVLVSATGSPIPIITKKMLAGRSKPIYIIDIAVPRDVDPSISELTFAHLYCIDDLKTIIQQNLHGRGHAAEKAREVIHNKSLEFMTWLNSFAMVATTIRAYRKQIEDICDVELAKALRQLQNGDDPVQVLTSFAHVFTNKLLHTPSVQLRQAGHEGRLEFLQLVQQLFAISEIKPEAL